MDSLPNKNEIIEVVAKLQFDADAFIYDKFVKAASVEEIFILSSG